MNHHVYTLIRLDVMHSLISLIFIAGLASGTVFSQDKRVQPVSYGLFGGVTLPLGDFGSISTTSLSSGAANQGFAFGGSISVPVGPNLHWLSTFLVSVNQVDSRILALPGDFKANLGSWATLWPLTGLEFCPPSSRDVNFHLMAQLGILNGHSPSVNITLNNILFSQPSSSATSFAGSIGCGVVLRKKASLDLRYLYGDPEYDIVATGGGNALRTNVSQPTGMFMFSLGFVFE
jgi:hypothetical protein